jgi:hypothetical protein
MPIHDWTRVSAGTFHDLHLVWTGELRTALNDGILPPDYYAQAEQVTGPFAPDVLALEHMPLADDEGDTDGDETGGGTATATLSKAAPMVRITEEMEQRFYRNQRRRIAIRHSSDDRVVALIEIVSPGNKESTPNFTAFVEKAAEVIYRGFHLLVIDLFPPTPRDPNGIHAAIWGQYGPYEFTPPPGEPLTLVSYSAGSVRRAYIEPTAVGHTLADMPLFLTPEMYVNVPLEETYLAAYRGVPRRWKRVLDATLHPRQPPPGPRPE